MKTNPLQCGRDSATREDHAEAEGFFDGPWGSLIYLAFLFLPLQRMQSEGWLATALAIGAFLPLHFGSFYATGPRLWLCSALIFLLGVALFPYNPFAHTLFIYAGFPAIRASMREAAAMIIVTTVASFAYLSWHDMGGVYYGVLSAVLLGVGFGTLGARAGRASRRTIAQKDEEIERLAQLAERERIARDLHDLLGHTLSLIAIKAELSHKLVATEPARASGEMREVAEVARSALSEVRQAIVGLRSVGLLDATQAADTMLRAAGLKTELAIASLPSLSPASEHALAQAVLEASTNIVRHAGASKARIAVAINASQLVLQVEDDGRSQRDIVPGNGLAGMRERLLAVGGQLDWSMLQPGMCLRASVPLATTS
ncbi:sensor histidine kinase [Chitinimonas sp. JJ19]|uniref:sensor histidine kinase n=1 Tax=Chitinimonas sp. JJ19 TaxID=3109352 RepID=UPI001A5C3687|nr:sensor histidine kinase [Chitinimonas sp.]